MNNQDISIGKLSRLKIWITDNHLSDDQWSNTKKFIIIKITTEDGIEGWGEAFSINPVSYTHLTLPTRLMV